MTQTLPIKDWTCTVMFNQDCGSSLKRLRLKPIKGEVFQCHPGQFVMLDLPLEAFHFRRPFSILSVQPDGSFDIYYKRVGKGTQLMWELIEGKQLQVLGPLGNRFQPVSDLDSTLFIGGGIGIAPLMCLAKETQTTGSKPGLCFYGTRTHTEIGLEAELQQLFPDRLYIATDDGSAHHPGNVCDLLMAQNARVQQAKMAYICGPTRMMEAASRLLLQLNPDIHIQVSLEEHMPCGTGACTGCVTFRTDQTLPSKVCVEGPVFNARSIQWQNPLLHSTCEVSACPS